MRNRDSRSAMETNIPALKTGHWCNISDASVMLSGHISPDFFANLALKHDRNILHPQWHKAEMLSRKCCNPVDEYTNICNLFVN